MTTRSIAQALLLALSAALSGCAVGNEYAFQDATPALTSHGAGAIAVATVDRRPDVVSGEEAPDYVGTQRGGFGNPFDVSTDSGKPFADDWTAAAERALKAGGYAPVTTSLPVNASDADAAAALAKLAPGKSVLFVLSKWHSDTYNNCTLHYDVTARVLGRSGSTLATKTTSGSSELGGSAWNPPAHAKKAVPEAFAKQIAELLDAPEIAGALR